MWGTVMSFSSYKCPECDANVSEEDESCPNCHVSFVMEDDDIECPVCGNIITASTEKCPSCGTEFEIVYEEYEEESTPVSEEVVAPPVPAPVAATEIDDQMDLDAEIKRIEEEERQEAIRRQEENALAESLSQEQVNELFQKAVSERKDITSVKQGDNELVKILDKTALLIEAVEALDFEAYTVQRLRDRTYMALHRGDKDAAMQHASEALALMESYFEDMLFYEQHFIGRIAAKYPNQSLVQELTVDIDDMVKAREEHRYSEALQYLKKVLEKTESLEPGFRRASVSFRRLTRAIAVSERFLVDNRDARNIITQTRDLVEKGRWKYVAELCDASLGRLMVIMEKKAKDEFGRIRSETAIARRKGEAGNDFLLSAAAEAQSLLDKKEFVRALDRISRYREEYRRQSA